MRFICSHNVDTTRSRRVKQLLLREPTPTRRTNSPPQFSSNMETNAPLVDSSRRSLYTVRTQRNILQIHN
ncbi:hypothetical protein F2P81_016400 [Scophthalmus maximus]|uniref:Uncharacterized protein n=1 Tax=Scophthalmus maximus TaxID=52904 RepID=A0A6A4SGV7_SCOMX|nr:hypothetical protein F2P81_016400 [Scophthalmus maximus]